MGGTFSDGAFGSHPMSQSAWTSLAFDGTKVWRRWGPTSANDHAPRRHGAGGVKNALTMTITPGAVMTHVSVAMAFSSKPGFSNWKMTSPVTASVTVTSTEIP